MSNARLVAIQASRALSGRCHRSQIGQRQRCDWAHDDTGRTTTAVGRPWQPRYVSSQLQTRRGTDSHAVSATVAHRTVNHRQFKRITHRGSVDFPCRRHPPGYAVARLASCVQPIPQIANSKAAAGVRTMHRDHKAALPISRRPHH